MRNRERILSIVSSPSAMDSLQRHFSFFFRARHRFTPRHPAPFMPILPTRKSTFQNAPYFFSNAPCFFQNAPYSWWEFDLHFGKSKAQNSKSKAHFSIWWENKQFCGLQSASIVHFHFCLLPAISFLREYSHLESLLFSYIHFCILHVISVIIEYKLLRFAHSLISWILIVYTWFSRREYTIWHFVKWGNGLLQIMFFPIFTIPSFAYLQNNPSTIIINW